MRVQWEKETWVLERFEGIYWTTCNVTTVAMPQRSNHESAGFLFVSCVFFVAESISPSFPAHWSIIWCCQMWNLYNHSYKVLTSEFHLAWLLDLCGYRKKHFNYTSAVGCEIEKSREKAEPCLWRRIRSVLLLLLAMKRTSRSVQFLVLTLVVAIKRTVSPCKTGQFRSSLTDSKCEISGWHQEYE